MSINTMNISELYRLYTYIYQQLEEQDAGYMVYENGVLDLYEKMLNGDVGRKDFLIFAITDMLGYIEKNHIDGIRSTAILRFNRIYKN